MNVNKKLFDIKLTKKELVHLRDLMSIAFPAENAHGQTVSQSLAELENRNIIEFNLWKKVAAMCSTAELPVGDEAPDYVIQMNAPPRLRVYEVMSDDESVPEAEENDEADEEEDDDTNSGSEEA